jgi:hypothetical protein
MEPEHSEGGGDSSPVNTILLAFVNITVEEAQQLLSGWESEHVSN